MKRALSHKFCPHCKKSCNIKTYREHKRLYFSQDLNHWYATDYTTNSEEEAEELDLDLDLTDESETGDPDDFEEENFELYDDSYNLQS